jgi:glycosyltransferase involved in cell wall biosynthesis
MRELAARAGLRQVHVLAWREHADEDAGGSEVHVSTVVDKWAAAGLDVTIRTSRAVGRPADERYRSYRAVRRGGRMTVFPRAAVAEVVGRYGPRDALVEIWNGVPWLSPVWAPRTPRLVWLHHVHGPMWPLMLPGPLARVGQALEGRLAPPLYRRQRIVTLAPSSRRELIDDLGFRPGQVEVVPPGVDDRFRPDPTRRAARPRLLAVGRFAPVKRFPTVVDAAAAARRTIPDLELVLVGDGAERAAVDARVDHHGAHHWVRFAGRVDDHELVELYRSAWAVVSASVAEGWGMTLTEAAACGTPAVATDIVGHRDAVVHGETGVLAADSTAEALGAAIVAVLGDRDRVDALGAAAARRAAALRWDATAHRLLSLLAEEAIRRQGRS